MIDGMILGTFTWLSFVLSFRHFPFFIKQFLLKNFFLTDICSIVISFILLTNISKSITSVIAAMLCGLLVNLTLIIHQEFYS
jgi:hypothetical protein